MMMTLAFLKAQGYPAVPQAPAIPRCHLKAAGHVVAETWLPTTATTSGC